MLMLLGRQSRCGTHYFLTCPRGRLPSMETASFVKTQIYYSAKYVKCAISASRTGGRPMRRELLQPAPSGEARLLLLIDAFSGAHGSLEGRTKLAKLDFLLRYPQYLDRALRVRAPGDATRVPANDADLIETRMIRYRYGPWDPSYFALLGSLIGRGLITTVSLTTGIGYRVTPTGRTLASKLSESESWAVVAARSRLLRKHFNLSGTNLKKFIYENFPEVAQANWGEQL